MSPMDRIAESSGSAKIVARSDVVVVGGGPAGFAAAIAARRQGCSVTLVERYPYLGGLASGGMVLVLDDMHNGDEVTVSGVCHAGDSATSTGDTTRAGPLPKSLAPSARASPKSVT